MKSFFSILAAICLFSVSLHSLYSMDLGGWKSFAYENKVWARDSILIEKHDGIRGFKLEIDKKFNIDFSESISHEAV